MADSSKTTPPAPSLRESAYYKSVIDRYLNALSYSSADSPSTDISEFFHPLATQTEFPNLLNPHGQESDVSTLVLRAEAARKFMSESQFEIVGNVIVSVQTLSSHSQAGTEQAGAGPNSDIKAELAVETVWTGTVARDIGERLKAGTKMTARIAMVFEFEDGQIRRQRNYDCFEPF